MCSFRLRHPRKCSCRLRHPREYRLEAPGSRLPARGAVGLETRRGSGLALTLGEGGVLGPGSKVLGPGIRDL